MRPAVLVVAACGAKSAAVTAPPRAPTAWALRCEAAVEHARAQAAAIEPHLARMLVEVEPRADHDVVVASAYPPYVDVGPVFLSVAAATGSDAPWDTRAMYELGGDHRLSTRTANHLAVTIGLDGWEPATADAVLAAMQPALEPCLGP